MNPDPRDRQWKLDSVIGPLYLVASENALHALTWRAAPVAYVAKLDDHAILARTVAQLNEYFAGRRRAFDIPLLARGGTEFQRLVWRALAAIPFGETRSYGELARLIARDRAVRAVGSANGRNPLAVVVPCHRVVAGDGTLGGFAGGLAAKARLLEIEGGWEQRGLSRARAAR